MQYLSYANVMEAVFLMVAALMYMLPLRKKEPIERRFISGLLLGSVLLIGPALVLPQTAITALFLTLFSLLILPFIIYYCVAIRKSAAFYVAIWSVVTTQFFMNLWHNWVLYRWVYPCIFDNCTSYAGKREILYWAASDDIGNFVLTCL